ncbi:MAG: sulfatase [Akkermansiaceae bacterium]|nr:sulfatase [Akkermansiaceae bacterium]
MRSGDRFRTALLCILLGSSASADQPNVVLLVADDLGYGELSCQRPGTDIPTPHIDSIAKDGVRFTQGYVTAPNCSPSRAGLLTGRIPTRFGYEFNPTGAKNENPDFGLPADEKTMAELLHDAGYTTALVGKWHLGGTAPYHPHRRGFDEFFGFTHEGHYFVPPPYDGVTTMLRRKALPGGSEGRWTSADGRMVYGTHMGTDEPHYDADNPIVRMSQPVNEPAYLTDAFTREALDFISRCHDRPFFLYLAYNAVHSPLQGADAYMEKFAHLDDIHRRIFAAMLANLDDSVGAVLGKLEELELTDDTLVVFLSDNGGPTRELTSSNAPLRGGKGTMYEGGLRVPFMMRWPGKIAAGSVCEQPVSSLDLLPTALAAAGADIPDHLDGVDLAPVLAGGKDLPTRTFYWRQGFKTALRHGDWKLVNMNRKQPRWELYNLATDLSEETNLAEGKADDLEELKALWQKLDAGMSAPRFR